MIYLYVKHHEKTGLKYFGKTTRRYPLSYKGSGQYWRAHINLHGKEHVVTDELWSFEDQDECTKFALAFSEQHNIVESEEWANLVPEDGVGGSPKIFSDEQLKLNQKASSKKLYEKKKEERKKKQLEYYYANREKRLAYHQANREHNIERQRQWRLRKLHALEV